MKARSSVITRLYGSMIPFGFKNVFFQNYLKLKVYDKCWNIFLFYAHFTWQRRQTAEIQFWISWAADPWRLRYVDSINDGPWLINKIYKSIVWRILAWQNQTENTDFRPKILIYDDVSQRMSTYLFYKRPKTTCGDTNFRSQNTPIFFNYWKYTKLKIPNRPSEYDKITFYNKSSCLYCLLGNSTFIRYCIYQMTIQEAHPTLYSRQSF